MIATLTGRRDGGYDIAHMLWFSAFALLAAAALVFLPVPDWVGAIRTWSAGLGWVAPIGFVLIYVFATLALLPVPVLAIAGGLVFGLWAFPIVLVGATCAAALSFLVARHAVRGRLVRSLALRPNLRTVDAAIAADGWRTVALLRIAPTAPLWIQPWLLGTTSVASGPFVVATAAGVAPGALLAVSIGAFAGAAISGSGTVPLVVAGTALVALLLATVTAARLARARLADTGFRPDG